MRTTIGDAIAATWGAVFCLIIAIGLGYGSVWMFNEARADHGTASHFFAGLAFGWLAVGAAIGCVAAARSAYRAWWEVTP